MLKRFTILFSVMTMGFATVFTAPALAEQPPPKTIVEEFHQILIEVMQQAESLNYQERHKMLAPAIINDFDSAFMSKIAAGAFWKNMSASEQASLTETFRNFTIANYASRFNGYSGQSFETISERDLRKNTKMIRTRLIKGDGDMIELDYLLRPHGESWAIFDVIPEGKFSELATRRSEFAPILRDKGVAGLLASLNEKIADLEESAESE